MHSRKNEINKKHQSLISDLKKTLPITWFDVGLFFDQLNDNRANTAIPNFTETKAISYPADGIGFITFDYGIDGVSVEIAKYAKVLENIIERSTGKLPKIHCIAETIKDESCTILEKRWNKIHLSGAGGFVDWDGYDDLFKTKLARGSVEYNNLISKIWAETIDLTEKLGKIIIEKNIKLLIPVNVCSNPGNVPLTMAIVLLSEYLSLPVINNSHDFYWEDGAPEWKSNNGLRDHFFNNAHIGEVFSVIENLFPWNSPLWYHTVLSNIQLEKLVYKFGFSPAQVAPIPTIVDTDKYQPVTEQVRYQTLKRVQMLFSNGKKILKSEKADNFLSLPKDFYKNSRPLFLSTEKGVECDLTFGNLLFMQPTRILPRKQIERGLDLILSLLKNSEFKELVDSADLTITLLVSGPVTREHVPYVEEVVAHYIKIVKKLSSRYRNRVFLAFRFGIESNASFKKNNYKPIAINELYQASNLVLLPSQQEGRGLPIIEGAACGVPILATRYFPQEVFAEVIGEKLPPDHKLSVFEIPTEGSFPSEILNRIVDFFCDPQFHSEDLTDNISVVHKRFSSKVLEEFFINTLQLMAQNFNINSKIKSPVVNAFTEFKSSIKYGTNFKKLTLCNNRKYLPGITKLENMVYLKSIIDPSFFRMEEKFLFGRIFRFAHEAILNAEKVISIARNDKQRFYNQVEYIFKYHSGKKQLIVDHSLSYRHRHIRNYPFRSLTEPEVRGVVGILLRDILPENFYVAPAKSYLRSLYMAFPYSVKAIAGTRNITIDHSEELEKALKSNRPIAWASGKSFTLEAVAFVDRTMRLRLKISYDEELTTKHLFQFDPDKIGPITLFVKEKYNGGNSANYAYVMEWLKNSASDDIKLLYKHKFFRIVKTKITSSGFHLGQLGVTAEKKLLNISENNGFMISAGNNNMLTLDLLNIDCFHIGFCSNKMHANYLGINKREGYILHVPAGLRPSLAYPTPIQTPKEFAKALDSKEYKNLCKKIGRKRVEKLLREDADKYGTPLKKLIKKLSAKNSKKSVTENYIESHLMTGILKDGSPYSGAFIKMLPHNNKQEILKFATGFASAQGDTVISIINKIKKKRILFGWNGGYILNGELVGKMGLPEDYIGSPLGLLIDNGKIVSLPLFNKPALAFDKYGTPSILEANLFNGFTAILKNGKKTVFTNKNLNNPQNEIAYFDLFYKKETIPTNNRTIYRFSGNRIIDIISDSKTDIPILPVGVTVSVKHGHEPAGWEIGALFTFKIPNWNHIASAIEAGPRIVRDGQESIEMENGGWNQKFSIRTQAARIDYTHMRGPKIGVGITSSSELIVAAINGRIRESEGCTHDELADILIKMGAKTGMGFDPGGSVTLVVDGEQLNISPYNKDFLKNIYALPPEARFVGNAVVAYL